jgi:hypothetical protein
MEVLLYERLDATLGEYLDAAQQALTASTPSAPAKLLTQLT